MQPFHPAVQATLSCLRLAELRAEADRGRLAHDVRKPGRAGRSTARALRSVADRLDPDLDQETAYVA